MRLTILFAATLMGCAASPGVYGHMVTSCDGPDCVPPPEASEGVWVFIDPELASADAVDTQTVLTDPVSTSRCDGDGWYTFDLPTGKYQLCNELEPGQVCTGFWLTDERPGVRIDWNDIEGWH
ncbi:MAG TPA: hypothetical protein VGG74_07660 [Kofleriaceae bacterium]|jgi:hypothetical protein